MVLHLGQDDSGQEGDNPDLRELQTLWTTWEKNSKPVNGGFSDFQDELQSDVEALKPLEYQTKNAHGRAGTNIWIWWGTNFKHLHHKMSKLSFTSDLLWIEHSWCEPVILGLWYTLQIPYTFVVRSRLMWIEKMWKSTFLRYSWIEEIRQISLALMFFTTPG